MDTSRRDFLKQTALSLPVLGVVAVTAEGTQFQYHHQLHDYKRENFLADIVMVLDELGLVLCPDRDREGKPMKDEYIVNISGKYIGRTVVLTSSFFENGEGCTDPMPRTLRAQVMFHVRNDVQISCYETHKEWWSAAGYALWERNEPGEFHVGWPQDNPGMVTYENAKQLLDELTTK